MCSLKSFSKRFTPREARPSKYGNKRVVIDGVKFHSKAEGEYWKLLKLREAAGEIKILTLQPRIPLTKAKIIYIADFLIEYVRDGRREYIDVKGKENEVFPLKKRLWAHYGMGTLLIVKKIRNGGFFVSETVVTAQDQAPLAK